MNAVCPECNVLNPVNKKFCNRCGASLETAKAVQEVERPQQPEPARPPEPAPQAEEAEQKKRPLSAGEKIGLVAVAFLYVLMIMICLCICGLVASNVGESTATAGTRTTKPSDTPIAALEATEALPDSAVSQPTPSSTASTSCRENFIASKGYLAVISYSSRQLKGITIAFPVLKSAGFFTTWRTSSAT